MVSRFPITCKKIQSKLCLSCFNNSLAQPCFSRFFSTCIILQYENVNLTLNWRCFPSVNDRRSDVTTLTRWMERKLIIKTSRHGSITLLKWLRVTSRWFGAKNSNLVHDYHLICLKLSGELRKWRTWHVPNILLAVIRGGICEWCWWEYEEIHSMEGFVMEVLFRSALLGLRSSPFPI
jgi:hypothetical protein